jgi:hypothetical protein
LALFPWEQKLNKKTKSVFSQKRFSAKTKRATGIRLESFFFFFKKKKTKICVFPRKDFLSKQTEPQESVWKVT